MPTTADQEVLYYVEKHGLMYLTGDNPLGDKDARHIATFIREDIVQEMVADQHMTYDFHKEMKIVSP